MMSKDGKVMFEVPLPDVSQAQQAKVRAWWRRGCGIWGGV